MDMDRLVRRVSEQLAARPSRRGIVSTAAKLATGAGVVLAGLRNPGEALALQGTCCEGPYECGSCPNGSKKRYQWFCNYEGARHLCRDCIDRSGNLTCVMVRR